MKNRARSPYLLRPGEAVTFVAEVASEIYRPEIQIQMKSADMSSFIWGFHSLYPGIAGVTACVALILAELFLLYAVGNESSSPTPASPPFALAIAIVAAVGFVLLVTPFIFGVVVQRFTRKVLGRTITPVAWNFFQFKVSAWTMRLRLKEFRKVMDAEYKKIAPN